MNGPLRRGGLISARGVQLRRVADGDGLPGGRRLGGRRLGRRRHQVQRNRRLPAGQPLLAQVALDALAFILRQRPVVDQQFRQIADEQRPDVLLIGAEIRSADPHHGLALQLVPIVGVTAAGRPVDVPGERPSHPRRSCARETARDRRPWRPTGRPFAC